MNLIQSLLPAIEHFYMIGYWIAFLAAFFETILGVGFFIPSSTIILFMGALAAKGYFDLGDLFWFAIIGAVIGDNINYFIGKKYGSKIFAKGFWFIKPEHFKKGEEFFKRHGSKSVFIGRLAPGLKETIPLIAGTLGMKRITFMVWNILGVISWSLLWILPGYFFAQSLDIAKIWLTRAGFFIAILLAVFIIFYVLKILLVKKGKQLFSFLFSVWQSIKQAIVENSEVKKFTEKHRALLHFLKRRLDKNKFFGLPFTLFFLALIYAFSLFGGIVGDVLNSDIIVSADIRVANLLAIFRTPELIRFFFWITLLGKWEIVLIFIIATILILWIWEKRSYIIPFLICVLGSESFTLVGKLIFHRARPASAVYLEDSFSFPSGHATIAIAFYGFLAYIIIRSVKKWKNKINSFFVGFIIIVLIGFSRLYLGVHYVSDVWGGYLIGAIWLIIAIGFSEYFLSKNKKVNAPQIKTKKYFVTLGLIVASVIFYILFALNYQLALLPKANKISKSGAMTIFNKDQLKL